MSRNSRNSNSSSSSSNSSAGNAKLPKVVAVIPRAFVSLADPAANSASFQTSSANVSMVRPAPNSASFQTSSANISMVRPAPNITSFQTSSANVSMVRPAQSSLALCPGVNSGQRSKSAKTRTDKDCVDIPVAVTIPSNDPSIGAGAVQTSKRYYE